MTHFSNWRLQNDDVMDTQSIFKGYHLAVTIWWNLLAGWLAGLAGRRFLVLIIKVTLSELSEASAPSKTLNSPNRGGRICLRAVSTRGARRPRGQCRRRPGVLPRQRRADWPEFNAEQRAVQN